MAVYVVLLLLAGPVSSGTQPIDVRSEQAAIRARWQSILGTGPGPFRPDGFEQLEAEASGKVLRRRIRYQVLPGTWTEAFLLEPLGVQGRRPGVVVFHSTNPAAHGQPAGRADRPALHLGLKLAAEGYVVLAPRCYIFEPARSYRGHAERLLRRWPKWTGMGRMLWDGQRALDLLACLPSVDPRRLAAVGHSLGAKETLYLAAFDSRVQAGVFSEGGLSLGFSNWDAIWYLGPQARTIDRDHDDLLALIAPRWFMVIGGGAADGEKSRPLIEKARRFYRAYGCEERLRLFVHSHGHRFPPEAHAAMVEFLSEALREGAR